MESGELRSVTNWNRLQFIMMYGNQTLCPKILLGTTKVNFFVVYKSGGVIGYSRSSILKDECTSYPGTADELRVSVKVLKWLEKCFRYCETQTTRTKRYGKISSFFVNGSDIVLQQFFVVIRFHFFLFIVFMFIRPFLLDFLWYISCISRLHY